MDDTRERIRNACQSHGCFHVVIRTSSKSVLESPAENNGGGGISAETLLPIECLAKERTEIERDIEELFSPSFFRDAVITPPNPSEQVKARDLCASGNPIESMHYYLESSPENSRYADICNGGLVEVPFRNDAKQTTSSSKPLTSTKTATFRGRIAESGNEKGHRPEPKLSWEFRRCPGRVASGGGGGNDATVEEYSRNECRGLNQAWNHLPLWINALHSIASVIVDQLGIPPRLVLQEEFCECDKRSETPTISQTVGEESKEGKDCHEERCNIDLLRVFRYDALPSSSAATSLGSSAHSDWGTLTVVWQDDKGGLQTYCHACDKWSDVNTSSFPESGRSQSASLVNKEKELKEKTTGCDSEQNAVRAFVHVGDFLSLATLESSGDNNIMPLWHSPRHRVQCPIRQRNNDNCTTSNSGNECRRSLVYFAYPPPGVSLSDAQRVVAPLALGSVAGRKDMLTIRDTLSSSFYSQYSLLHNQAKKSPEAEESNGIQNENGGKIYEGLNRDESVAYETYEKIRNLSFHEAIFDKWSQVQRK